MSYAAGFYIQEQGVKGQGSSFAGVVAYPEDASTIFFNPAGLMKLENRPTIVMGGSLLLPRAEFRNNGSTAGLNAGAQASYTAGRSGNPFSATGVPSFYAAQPLANGRYWLGLGVTAPFGMGNKHNSNWFGRYDSIESDLKTLDIAPVFAMRVNDRLSLGGGPNLQFVDADLQSALPCPAVAAGCGAVFAPSSDGLSRLQGRSWGAGFNIGALYALDAATEIGAHYRSAITHDVDGSTTISGLSGALAGSNGLASATSKLKLPDIITLGAAHQMTEQLTLLGSASWYGWSAFNEIRVRPDAGGPDAVIPQNYEDSYSIALGAAWQQTERLTFRGGVQFDKTPTTDGDRSTRTPDGDRTWISVGASFAVTDRLTLDAAATHIFMENGDINLTKSFYTGTGLASTVRIRGTSENQVDIFSLQGVLRF